jgi:hypothetical protein
MNVLTACDPRPDILKGTFNPEIFTAQLSEVIRFYRGQGAGIHSIYTDARQFFQEATYPTEGLKMVLADVFARLSGDSSAPAIHRLETAFGGGKTHTLIACAHLAFKGRELADVADGIVSADLLGDPGGVSVVGVAGDDLPVHKPVGEKLVPYTLWGEIAFQVGGETLYQQVKADAESPAAPGRAFLDKVLGGRKALLMLDELAQYAARLAAANPRNSEQLAAFLMGLHGYARANAGIAIVLTLAGTKDAFGNQTEQLRKMLADVIGKEIGQDAALGIGQQAVESIASVVARDATSVVPVQAAEISRVLSKRLFVRIDAAAAESAAHAYMEVYRRNSSLLPDEATRDDFKDRLAAHYPFHPTLINFLNYKLATYENFQGTRGVLRVLTLAVRRLWQKQAQIPMIHTCHLDLRDARTVNELIGRTGAGDLLPILNADIGGPDTGTIAGGRSNAELADQKNPHPEGWPMYEYTWKAVFLHSLVGRDQELGSGVFGLTEQEALFEVSFPGLTPPQVAEALKEIGLSAFYLRYNQGRYYASLDPSVNIALARIRRSLNTDEVDALLDATARKVVSSDIKTFKIATDVTEPEHIPDKEGRPVLAIVKLNAEQVDIEAMVTTAGVNRPRIEQNMVLILVPDSVQAKIRQPGQGSLFRSNGADVQQTLGILRELARTVLAMRRLQKNPQAFGLQPQKLQNEDVKQRSSERERALETVVTQSYKQLWYPSASGQIVCKEIRTAGGEGGVSVLEQIRRILLEEGELITLDRITNEVLSSLRKLFFNGMDTVKLETLRENFCRLRRWPMLESLQILDQIVRGGVGRGVWCLFRMGSADAARPEEFYSRESGEVPFHLDLKAGDYGLVTPEGAVKRGWTTKKGPDPGKVIDWVRTVVWEEPQGAIAVGQLGEKVDSRFGQVPEKAFKEAVTKLVQEGRVHSYKGTVDQTTKPEALVSGPGAAFYQPDAEDIVITTQKAAEKAWIKARSDRVSLSGKSGAKVFLPLLRRVGSLYQRGGKTKIDSLDLVDLELPGGGMLRVGVTDASPDALKNLGELFEVIDGIAKTEKADVYVEINDPQKDCPFMQELLKNMGDKEN